MGIQKFILNIIFTVESFFLHFLKIKKNRITFISLESNQLTLDFLHIYEALDKDKYDVRLCLIHYQKNILGQFLYLLNCMKQLYYIYTSHMIVINDNNYAISHFKRDGVIVFQLWHACGAIKKFGNVINRKYKIKNYDYVLSTSSYWKKPYSEAFGVPQDHVLPLGMPRNDELFNQDLIAQYRASLYQKYPQLIGKKIVLYAPTFRGNIYNGFRAIPFDAKKIIDHLSDDYVILYKYHPLLGNVQLSHNDRIMNMNNENTHQLFCIADYLISDYSSIVFDYMILEKPLIFFIPDLDEYIKDVGVFVDISSLQYPVCQNEEEIIQTIQSGAFDKKVAIENKKMFFDIPDGDSTKRVVRFIEKVINQ